MYTIQTAFASSEAIHEMMKIEMLNNTLSYLKKYSYFIANSYTLSSGFLNPSVLKAEKKKKKKKLYYDCKGFILIIHMNNLVWEITHAC